MKIVFVQPKTMFGNTWEALGVGYIASFLKQHGYDNIDFFSGFFDSDREIIEGCRDADVVGFSCTSPQMKHALALAEVMKKDQTKEKYIVFGGVHPSVLPEECLINSCVDAVVTGEGERAFLHIVKGFRESVVKMPYIEDLDLLPFPDRYVVKQERNIQQAFRDNGVRIASIFTSRGCPFSCTFCASHSVWTRKVRFRSADNILQEFESVAKDMKIDLIKFSDDTFTIKKQLVYDFCEKKIKRGIKTPWGCNIRADRVDESLLGLMKAAGCKEVWIGVESGSPKILKHMEKGIDLEKIKWVFKTAADLGLYRRAYMLLGMPEESREDIKLSENLVEEISPDMVGFTILAPYPGTAFFDPVKHKDVDWAEVDEYGNRITRTEYLTNEELIAEQKRLVAKFQKNIVFRQKEKR
jgi:radical SAM superfamily enzyme YgiQ (UPF0313 family)